jgi:hypothetical protein
MTTVVKLKFAADGTVIGHEPRLVLSSEEFDAGFVPPDYLIDGILQRRFIYSMTAPTGGGKTAIALLLSALVGEGRLIGSATVDQGRVLYLAGENPDDIRMRWRAMSDKLGFDIKAIEVHFIAGTFEIPKLFQRITDEIELIGDVALIVVDTSAAYFQGEDENSNVQMGNHARMLRKLTTLPGKPCVIVCCHPTKGAGNDNLLPRGGGAFIAEMDGNLVCLKKDSVVDLSWQGKFRGPDFNPIGFQLLTVTSERVRDGKGRHIPTVMAKPLTEKVRTDIESVQRRDEDAMLTLLLKAPGGSFASMAQALGWLSAAGEPQKKKAWRVLQRLQDHKLVTTDRDQYVLTDKGKKEAQKVA